jgi:hypothetical protein
VKAFTARLREQVDLDALAAELLAVADQTMQPTRASLVDWMRWARIPVESTQLANQWCSPARPWWGQSRADIEVNVVETVRHSGADEVITTVMLQCRPDKARVQLAMDTGEVSQAGRRDGREAAVVIVE